MCSEGDAGVWVNLLVGPRTRWNLRNGPSRGTCLRAPIVHINFTGNNVVWRPHVNPWKLAIGGIVGDQGLHGFGELLADLEAIGALNGEEKGNFVQWRSEGLKQSGSFRNAELSSRQAVIVDEGIERVVGNDGAERMADDGDFLVLEVNSIFGLGQIDGRGRLKGDLLDF